MYLTGFADEAASDLAGQIQATQALGWKYIESRNIGGVNIHDLPERDFETAVEQLGAAGIQVNCFGSAIGNWASKITDPFEVSLAQARRAIPRMQRLGAQLVRVMSYAVLEERSAWDQLEAERFRRLRILTELFKDAGLTPVHENCMNYGGMSWQHTLKLLENVPGLKLVFDTGNPVFSADCSKPVPHPRQSSWEFYRQVKEHILYVHIKDGIWDKGKQTVKYTFPGEGEGEVERIVRDLVQNGYDGGFSMEPHLNLVQHESSVAATAEAMFRSYIEYGRRFETLLRDVV
jgi:sugar phosphate isomerase/epimerase